MSEKKSPKDWSPLEQYDARQIYATLRKIAPNIRFSAEWNQDESFVWDGNPDDDPTEFGYVAHDVDVTARAIVYGDDVEGRQSLGGVYDKPYEKDPDIHGYLPQMLEEAAADLERQVTGEWKKQLQAARKYLKEVLRGRYRITPRR
jgi:hypothetical protein